MSVGALSVVFALSGGEPTTPYAKIDAVAMLPVVGRWMTDDERRDIEDTVRQVAVDVGLPMLVASGPAPSACWGSPVCYQDDLRWRALSRAVAVEAMKTSSGKVNLTLRVVDAQAGVVGAEKRLRSRPEALRQALRPLLDDLRLDAALPAPKPAVATAPAAPETGLVLASETSPPAPLAPATTGLPELAEVPPEPVEPAATLAKEAPAPAAAPGLGVNGFLSASWSYNMNRPRSETNQLRAFDHSDNSIALDVVELCVSRQAPRPGDAGFRVDLTAGSSVPRVTAASGLFRDSSGEAGDIDLQQAYATYVAPLGSGLRFEGGKFVTHVGAEVIEGYDNFNDQHSRSFSFLYGIPFTHTGLRASYTGTKVGFMAGAWNGWDNVKDGNDGKSFGAMLTLTPHPTFSSALGYLGGPEQPGNSTNWRHVGNLVAQVHPSPQATIAIDLTYGHERIADAGAAWWGAAAYLRFRPTGMFQMALRAEVFDDRDGSRTGTAQRLLGATLTPALLLPAGIVVRGEARYDRSSTPAFDAAGVPATEQLTFALNTIWAH